MAISLKIGVSIKLRNKKSSQSVFIILKRRETLHRLFVQSGNFNSDIQEEKLNLSQKPLNVSCLIDRLITPPPPSPNTFCNTIISNTPAATLSPPQTVTMLSVSASNSRVTLIVSYCDGCRGRRNGGMKPLWGEKFTAQWHPLCRWCSHFLRECHAFRLYCIDFHALNSLILKDNVMDATWCEEWPIFNAGSSVGYSETALARGQTVQTDAFFLCAPTLTCFQLYYRSARWLRRGFHKVTWPSLFLHRVCVWGGHLNVGSCFRWQQEDE